jgi:sec-independent protein translocase protein TatA
MKLFDSPATIILILVVILLFGSKKLPDAARGVGRSLRIFKAETKGLMTDDEGQSVPPAVPPQITGQTQPVVPPVAPVAPVAPAPPVAPVAPVAPAPPVAPVSTPTPQAQPVEAEKTES